MKKRRIRPGIPGNIGKSLESYVYIFCISSLDNLRNPFPINVMHRRIVVWKLRDVRHEDTPEINNPKIRFPVLEGDKLKKEVLNGG